MASRIAVFGLDGASFEILEGLASCGLMPNMAKLLKTAGRGVLNSTVPIYTVPSWVTCWSGVSPKTHGVLYWRQVSPWLPWRDDAEDPFSFVPFGKIPMLWDFYGEIGLEVGCIDIPLGFPAPDIKGFFTGGIMAPPNSDRMYSPPGLLDNYPRWLPEVVKDIHSQALRHDMDQRSKYLTQLGDQVEMRRHFLSEHLDSLDVLVCVNVIPDRVSHMDFEALRKLSQTGKGESELERCWRETDLQLGQVLDWLGEDGYLMCVSDHGFDSGKRLNIVRWLEKIGVKSPTSAKTLDLQHKIAAYIPTNIKDRISNTVKKFRSIPEYLPLTANPNNTLVWSPTVDGRASYLFISPDATDKAEIINKIIEGVENCQKIDGADCPFKSVQTGLDLFGTQSGATIPDLVILPNDDWILTSEVGSELEVLPSGDVEAVHHMKGILIAKGPGVKSGLHESSEMVDILPTLLNLAGIASPGHLEGKSIDWISSVNAENLKSVEESIKNSQSANKELSDEERFAMEAHLQSLGYLD